MRAVTGAQRAFGAAGALAAVGLSSAVWGTCIERYLFTVRRHELALLPPGSPSLTVLHLSDAHMAPWQHRKQAWIAEVAERVQPDLVINTGDNLGHEDGLRGIRTAFAPLGGVPGAFVHGSNDVTGPSPRNPLRYFQGPSQRPHRGVDLDTAAMDAYFRDDLGWVDLNNAASVIDVAGLHLDAFGVSDAHRDWDDLGVLPGELDDIRRHPWGQRSPAPTALTVGVTHAPYRRVLDAFTDLGADIIFGGHTHGGQVRIPFSRSALVANCDIPRDQARGLSTWTHDGRTVPLNVSAGLGHSIYAPVRFACRPEVSVLEIRATSPVDSA